MTPASPRAGERVAAKFYRGVWGVLARWFRVPAEPPTLPAREDDELHSFHPSIGFLRYLKFWFWILLVLIDGAIMIGWLLITIANPWVGLPLLPVALAVAILPDIVAYVAIHLRYDTTWYVMTNRSLRIRRGIWIIQETTITFENVQNVKISQGPVQRYFDISNLIVETAGAGGKTEKKQSLISNQGIIEGVQDAQQIRDRILARMRASRTAGLGDEDDTSTQAAARARWSDEHLAVLREIRDLVSSAA